MVQRLHNNSKIVIHEKHKNGSLHIQKHEKTHVYASPTFLGAKLDGVQEFVKHGFMVFLQQILGVDHP
jgi:hypothetical protein